ncbi:gamma-glutamylcyclotransferase [Chamaesiphon sp.]|uniref:allophanate hydrolase-related protein n=1 Tax=Chamaesiphon sp. TaxID=2814140 RepID=UPI0035933A57
MNQTIIAKHQIFICGSALRGQPDHSNLGNAKFIRAVSTEPIYRLHAAENGWHPAIYQVDIGGISIPGEIYEMTEQDFEYLKNNEPPHMYPTEVKLADGEVATAFFYPQALIERYNWPDISDLGGWAAYKQTQLETAART